VCTECGHPDVWLAAWIYWDEKKQDWQIDEVDVDGDSYCRNCGADTVGTMIDLEK
jgi:hypothetical protein